MEESVPERLCHAGAAGDFGICAGFFGVVSDWPLGFIIGALFMIAIWPWTLLVMKKTNQKLMTTTLGDVGAQSRGLIVKWNGLHAVRTVLGGLAVVAFLMALSGM